MRPGKIPVFRATGAGIRFLFANFFKIMRASLVPGLIAGVSLFALHWYVVPGLSGQTVVGLGQVQNPFYGLPFVAVYLFAILMFSVGLARVYFGQPIGLLYSRVGPQELRFFGGTLTVVLLMFLFCGLPMLVLSWTLFTFVDFSTLPPPVTRHVTLVSAVNEQDRSLITVVGVAAFALMCLYAFMSFRFSLLLPVVAQERRVGVLRTWTLTRGNFWRLFFVSIFVLVFSALMAVPIFFLASFVFEQIMGEPLNGLVVGGPVTLESFMTVKGLVALGADALYYLVAMSLYVGALGYAYKKLIEDERAVSVSSSAS